VALDGGPGPPAGAVVLGQCAEPGVGLQVVAHLVAPALEPEVGADVVPQHLQGPPLERPGGVAVDEGPVVQPPPPGGHLDDRRVAGRTGQLVDAKGEGGQPAAAGREVGARLDPADRQRGVERADRHHAGPAAGGPGADGPEVGQVADAPAALRPARRELDRQQPGPQVGGQVAAAGGHDEPGDGPAVERPEVVVPDRHVGWQRPLDPLLGAVLQLQLARPEQRFGGPRPDDPEGPPAALGTAVSAAHGGAQRGPRVVGRRVPPALHVEVSVVDTPRIGGHRRARYPWLQGAVRGASTTKSAGGGLRGRCRPAPAVGPPAAGC
jgi:hypothetical protein